MQNAFVLVAFHTRAHLHTHTLTLTHTHIYVEKSYSGLMVKLNWLNVHLRECSLFILVELEWSSYGLAEACGSIYKGTLPPVAIQKNYIYFLQSINILSSNFIVLRRFFFKV